MANINAA